MTCVTRDWHRDWPLLIAQIDSDRTQKDEQHSATHLALSLGN